MNSPSPNTENITNEWIIPCLHEGFRQILALTPWGHSYYPELAESFPKLRYLEIVAASNPQKLPSFSSEYYEQKNLLTWDQTELADTLKKQTFLLPNSKILILDDVHSATQLESLEKILLFYSLLFKRFRLLAHLTEAAAETPALMIHYPLGVHCIELGRQMDAVTHSRRCLIEKT